MGINSRSLQNVDAIWVILALIIVGAAVLRLVNLGTESFWGDEIASVQFVAKRGFFAVIHDTFTTDVHPFLYYALLDRWVTIFGCSEWACRSLSVVIGVGSILVVFVLAKTAFNCKWTAALSALLLAVNPTHMRYSQEARMYILMILIWAIFLYYLLRCWQTRCKLSSSVGLGLSFIAFAYSHGIAGLLAFPLLLCAGVFFVARALQTKSYRQVFSVVVVVISSVLAYIPWCIRLLNFRSTSKELLSFDLNEVLFFLQWLLFSRQLISSKQLAMFFVAVAIVGLVLFRWKPFARKKLFIPIFPLLGSILLVLASQFLLAKIKPCYQTRNLVFLLAPFLLSVSFAIVQCSRLSFHAGIGRFKAIFPLVFILILTVSLFSKMSVITAYKLARGYGKESWRQAVGYVQPKLRRGDILTFYAGFMQPCWDYYYFGFGCDPKIHYGELLKYKTFAIPRTRNTNYFNKKMQILLATAREMSRTNSLWVFYSHANPNRVDSMLRGHDLCRVAKWKGYGIVMFRYKKCP